MTVCYQNFTAFSRFLLKICDKTFSRI